MNFKPRSPFQPPSYPGSLKNRNSSIRAMQEQDKSPIKNSSQISKPIQRLRTQSYLSSGTMERKFCFEMKQPDQNDDQIYWKFNLSNQVSGQYLRYIIFKQQQYFVRNVPQDAIIDTIYIHCDDLPGYLNDQGIVTNKVCALRLSGTFATKDSAGIKYYDLLYRQSQDLAWKVPLDLTQLRFRILSGDIFLKGSLQTPLMTQFQLKHVGK